MSLLPAAGDPSRAAFRIVALAALLAALTQVTLGGVVRVTDSGLGCPDWPLCHGKIIPQIETATLIEYSHRLSAALLGLLSLAAFGLALRAYRFASPVVVSSTTALALVVVAAILGGVSVRTELAWWVVLLHLGVAQLVVGFLVVALAAGWMPFGPIDDVERDERRSDRLGLLVVAATVGVFALILLGSYMVGRGYGSVCATWPLCRGGLLPEGTASAVHMLHRYVAGAVGLLVAAMAVSAWSLRARRPDLAWAALAAAGLFAAQVLVGALTVWTGFSVPVKAIHLSAATLLWASMVSVAALMFLPRRLESGHLAKGIEGVAGLEAASP